MTLTAGATVGRYTILEPLGQGGMATVYKAFQPSLEREVALKVLRPGFAQDKEFLERFEREAKAIARLRHPHIVQVFDFEMTEGQYVLAMEFLEGGTLKDRQTELARAHRGMDPQESVRIVAEVAEALTYAHEQGIVHRDVKPSNVMLTRKDWAVVTDFGIARILGATSHTQTGVGIGTPEYMAPEQGQGGRVDHRADIYSLGAMAYEMLTGQVPYTADTPLAVVIAHIKDPLPLPSKVNPTIGPAVERVLLRALAKDPEQRFASATDMAQSLREGLAADAAGGTMPTMVVRAAGGTTAAASAGATAEASKQVTLSLPPQLMQRPVMLAGAGLLVLALVAGGALAGGAFRGSPGPTNAPNGSPAVGGAPAPIGAGPSGQGSPQLSDLSFAAMRGDLVYDGSREERAFSVTGPAEFAKLESGVLEITTPEAGTRVEVGVGPELGTQLATEMDVTIAAGSTMRFAACVRADGVQRYCFTLVGGTASMKYLGTETSIGEPVGDEISNAVSVGQTNRVGIVVDGPTFTAFVNERAILQARDTRIAASRGPLSFQAQRLVASPDQSGTARVENIRQYKLATSASAATVAPAAVFTPAPTTPAPAPKYAVPAKGTLLYEAKLDGSSSDLRSVQVNNGGPSDSAIDFLRGAIELAIVNEGGATAAEVNQPLRTNYVGEIEVSFAPGSENEFTWILRTADKGFLWLTVFARDETMHAEWIPDDANHEELTPVVSLPGLRTGKTFTIAVVIEGDRYSAYLDQKQVLQFTEARAPQAARTTIGVSGPPGRVRVLGLRYYDLP